ncbi:MAG: PrsW family glutamic-type intramembrane protease [Candidatus Spechtbacterales bacterium]
MVVTPLAIIPPLAWLFFFATQDRHREKLMDLTHVFLWGVALAVPVIVIENILSCWFVDCREGFDLMGGAAPFLFVLPPVIFSFLAIAFVEELGKYLVVRFRAVSQNFLEEPQDAMVYMITAALGFAAIENILYALGTFQNPGVGGEVVVQIIVLRSITANILHIVASATLGYFLALALANPREFKRFLYTGLALATLLHGIFNTFIIRIVERNLNGQFGAANFETILLVALLIISGIIILTTFYTLAKKTFS